MLKGTIAKLGVLLALGVYCSPHTAQAVDLEESTNSCMLHSSLLCQVVNIPPPGATVKEAYDILNSRYENSGHLEYSRFLHLNQWPLATALDETIEAGAGFLVYSGFHPNEFDESTLGSPRASAGQWKFANSLCFEQIVDEIENDVLCKPFLGKGFLATSIPIESFFRDFDGPHSVDVELFVSLNGLAADGPVIKHQTFYLIPGYSLSDYRKSEISGALNR